MHGTDRFDIVSFLHSGDNKKFFKVQCIETKQLYTMEVIPNNKSTLGFDSSQSNGGDRGHVKSLENQRFPFCMGLRFFFEAKLKYYYILDYIGERNLETLVKQYDGFTENAVLFVAAELAVAVKGFHDRGLSYGEVNLGNVMLDNTGHVVLWREFFQKCYWDASECLCCFQGLDCGNEFHENKKQRRHDFEAMKNDWRELGVVLRNMIVRCQFHEQESVEEGTLPESVSSSTRDFINGLLTGSVQSFEEVKSHYCFTDMDWDLVKSKSLQSPFLPRPNGNSVSAVTHHHPQHSPSWESHAAEVSNHQLSGFYCAKPTLSRTSSFSELLSSSGRSAIRTPQRYSTTSSHNLFHSVQSDTIQKNSGTTRNYEDHTPRNRTSPGDYYSSDTEMSTKWKSYSDAKWTPPYSSNPSSPKQQSFPSYVFSRYSSSLTNIPDSTALSATSNYFNNHGNSPYFITDTTRDRETLHRSQSSTDLASLVSRPEIRTLSDKWQSTSLNRSWSYSNLNETLRDIQNGTGEDTKFDMFAQKLRSTPPSLSHSWSYSNLNETLRGVRNDAGQRKNVSAATQKLHFTSGSFQQEKHEKRSLAWTPIPTFEQFRAMRSQNKTKSDGIDENNNHRSNRDINNNNHDSEIQYSVDRGLRKNHVVSSSSSQDFPQVHTTQKKKPSLSSNPVIQELLVKYGLHKSADETGSLPVESVLRHTTSPITTPSVQTEITSSKHRLLSIVDDFLANRRKERSMTSCVSASEIGGSRRLLRERRTVSSPRMTRFEKFAQENSKSCSDVYNNSAIREKVGIISEINSCPEIDSCADKPVACTENTLGEPSQGDTSHDFSASEQFETKNSQKTAGETSKCDLKELGDRKNREQSERKTKGEKATEKLTKKTTFPRQQTEEKQTSIVCAQPEISLEEPSDDALSSPDVPQEHATVSWGNSGRIESSPWRTRSSSELVKKRARKERKGRSRSLIQESRRPHKGNPANAKNKKIKHLRGLERSSSLLSLTDSVTSYDDRRDMEIGEEIPKNDRNLQGCSRSSSLLSVDTNSGSFRRERPVSRDGSFLSVMSDTDRDNSTTGSTSSQISRGSSFLSNISTDSGSIHLDFVVSDDDDDDGDVFSSEPQVFHEKTESEIKRNDSGLGDEIGVTSRLRKRWEDIVDVSSRQWSIVSSSARYWREMTMKKKEKRLQQQQQQSSEGRKISHGRKISRERPPSSIDCPDCGRPFVVDKDKPSIFSEGPKRCLICYKCQSHRIERKEAIIELVQTEINYGNDFRILKEIWLLEKGYGKIDIPPSFLLRWIVCSLDGLKEFLSPMQTGGIVSPDNLAKIFLNIQELLDVSMKFCKKIETSMQECIGKNDEEFCHMQVGKIFVENVEFFQAYELYCSKQPESISLLESLQKKNEVLRVFLNITCRENPKCRKMDINSFLLAPVQRVMKYPLLLSRIRRATPRWHGDREDLKLAQRKVEDQIAKINSLTKSSEVKTKKFHSNLGNSESVDSSRLKKLACDVLSWTIDEIQLLMHGVLKVTSHEFGGVQGWTKRAIKRSIETHLLFCIRGQNEPIRVDSDDDEGLQFPRFSEVSDASLLLLKRKTNGKYTLFRDEIKLRDCVVYEETVNFPFTSTENGSFGLTHMGKETFVFTARTPKDARRWLKHLRLQTKDQGKWRRRRNASANIMLKAS